MRLIRNKGLAAVLGLLLLTLIFMRQALFPPDGLAVGAHDMRGLFYPWFTYLQGAIRLGQLPFWDPYQFLGYPFLSNPQVAFFYPPTWLAILLPVNVGISWYIVLHIWLSAVGMLFFVRNMQGSWLGSLIAAVSYGFSGFVAARLWAGHIGLLATFAWLPWMLLATVWSVRKGELWAAVVAGVPFGLSVLAGHTPSFLYVVLIWSAFVMYLALTDRARWTLVVRQAFISAVVGFGIAAVQLVPFAQLSLYSQRLASSDFEFATDYSLPPAHLITLVLPEFFGEPTRIGYWSVPSFEELTYYTGALILIGLVLALRRPRPLVWFYVLLIVGGLWLALGRYSALYRIAYDLIPLFRMMRAPGRSAVLFVFAGAALAGYAVSLWQGVPLAEKQGTLRQLFRWLMLLVLLGGVVGIAATGAVFMAVHPTDTSGRLWHQIGGYASALVFLLFGSALLWGFLVSRPEQVLRRRILAVAIMLLLIADLWQFGMKFISLQPMGPNEMWQDGKAIIGDDGDRVLPWGVSIFDQSGAMEVGLPSVFGYQALEPANLVAFTSTVPDPRSTAYDILGASFVVAPVPLEQFTGGEGGLQLVENRGSAWVYRREKALPLSRLLYEVEVIADRDAAAARVHQPDFDPSATAILEREPPCELGPISGETSTATIEATRSGYWRIRTSSEAPALLLLAEADYPGWQVTVDGEPAEALRAYNTIRAVCVPAGEHVVEWNYVPSTFLWGGIITILTVILVGLVIVRRVLRSHSAGL